MSVDFDRWASVYEDSPLQPVFQAAHQAVIAQANQICSRPRRILDVGCGTGRLLRSASATFLSSTLVGLDPSRGMLLAADPACPVALVRAQAERLPFAEGSFDLVLATSSYRHWSDPRSALREIARVLAPDGRLILADVFSPSRRLPSPGRPAVPASLRSALVCANLTVVEIQVTSGYGPISSITLLSARRLTAN
jgi:ubiquinone/menaquinone biosynthesis C-methylase UbiE